MLGASSMKVTKREFLFGAGAGLAGVAASQFRQRMASQKTPYDYSVLSYSQSGEDLIVSFLFQYTLGISKPTYIDIGAAHPTRFNNTYLFYRRGASGVLVEPNVTLIPALTSTRPRDTVLNVGIGVTDQDEANYYVCANPD